MSLLLDTGPLVAGANSRDHHHAACRDLLRTHPGPLLIPATVIVEVCQATRSSPRPGRRGGAPDQPQHQRGEDRRPRANRLPARRRTRHPIPRPAPGRFDATVIAVAERLRIPEVATLDRRHFSVVQPAHVDAFTLLPEVHS